LYVNDTDRQHIRVFDVTASGGVANGRLFAHLSGTARGVADGMKVDAHGFVYSCGPGGIHLFTPHGVCLGVISLPEFTTNFVFGDADWRTLYVTASTSLYRLRVQVAGHPTYKGSQQHV
jgi:gluconolactonase